jgi:predicted dehydrogenase
MKPLRGVMIGAGFFARFQAESWRRMEGVRIEAVADPDLPKARAFAQEFGIPRVYAAAEEMLRKEEADFADIVTRPDTHGELTLLAASHRLAVICQKPMAPAWEECLWMVEVCRQAGVRLLIHENWRFQPWYREARRLLDAGMLGRLCHLSFLMRNGDGAGPNPYTVQPYFREMPRFLLYETGIHFLDTFRYLAGEIEDLHCRVQRMNPRIAGEDAALVSIRFTDGPTGLLDANRLSGPNPPEPAFGVLQIEGDLASLRLAPDGRLFFKEHGGAERAHPYALPADGYRGDSVHACQRHLADALALGFPAESEGSEYLKSVAAMFACYESAAAGEVVRPGAWLARSKA